jgi:hypothetical protein
VSHTDAGSFDNTASVTVADDEDNTASDSDDETVTVTDALPSVTLDKSADPTTLPEPGGAFTFTLTITNTSVETVTITALSDDNALSTECLDLIGTTLAAGASTSCTYTVSHTDAGSFDNTASVTVADDEDNTASDSDDETVTVTNVAPVLLVDKTANPTSVSEHGGNVTFTVTVKNVSVSTDPVTITSLTDVLVYDTDGDDNYAEETPIVINIANPANPNTTCDELIGVTLQPGETSSPCTFTVHIQGNPWEDPIDTVTAHAEDDEGTDTSDSDDAAVDIAQVNQRSVSVSGLTARRTPTTVVSGRFSVTDESDEPPVVDVLINNIFMTFEKKVKTSWQVITPTSCTFWVDDGDGIKESGEPLIANPSNAGLVVEELVYIGYSCTLSSGWPSPLRITANVQIDGRPGMTFRFTNSFTFG